MAEYSKDYNQLSEEDKAGIKNWSSLTEDQKHALSARLEGINRALLPYEVRTYRENTASRTVDREFQDQKEAAHAASVGYLMRTQKYQSSLDTTKGTLSPVGYLRADRLPHVPGSGMAQFGPTPKAAPSTPAPGKDTMRDQRNAARDIFNPAQRHAGYLGLGKQASSLDDRARRSDFNPKNWSF